MRKPLRRFALEFSAVFPAPGEAQSLARRNVDIPALCEIFRFYRRGNTEKLKPNRYKKSNRIGIFQTAFLSLSLFLFSCVSFESSYQPKEYLKKPKALEADKLQQQTWRRIKNKKTGTLSEKIKSISDFIALNKNKDLALEAYLLQAKLLSQNKQRKEACFIYHKVVQSSFYYKGSLEAYKASAGCYLKERKLEKALTALETLIHIPHADIKAKKEAARMQWSFLKRKKKFRQWKLISLSHLLLFSVEKREKQVWKRKGEAVINSLSVEELVSYARQADKFLFFKSYLLYRAGLLFWEKEKFSDSKKFFKKALMAPLSSHRKRQVKQKLELLKQAARVNPYLIGVLIPLSGRKKALGEKVLRGLALGLEMEKDSPWQMVILDSKSHPDVVREHLENLFYKYHVIGIIGGFTSETAEVIAKKAEEFLTPALLFSQKEGLAFNRSFVFQNSITATQLLSFLIQQSQKRLNIKKAAILYPDDLYGKNYAQGFEEMFTSQGGEIVGKAAYKFGEVDFKSPVKKLLHLNVKGREEEFEKLKQEALQNSDSITERSRKLTPENLLPVKKEFEALFIPDSLSQVKKITNHLRYFGVKDIYLLGTNLWEPEQKQLQSKEFPLVFVNLPEKTGNFIKKNAFYKNFVSAYAQPPGVFEQRAYNSALFFKKALDQKIRSRLIFQKELKKAQKVQGAGYPISISKEGVFQYPLHFYIKKF